MENEQYNKIYEEQQNEEKKGTNQEYFIRNNKLFKKHKDQILQIVPRWKLESIMKLYHDHETAAHFGIDTTYDKIKEKYYWPTMRKDIEIYVKTCDQCQRRGKSIMKNELHSIKILGPFQRIGIDIIGPLPVTIRGNRYIVTAMDYFTKWPEARAIKTANAEEVSSFIYEDIICRHGCPQKILTDRGSHFNNQLIARLMEKFEIVHNLSTPYHPKTNGLIERFNKTLCEALAKLKDIENWDTKVAPVLLAYRTTKHGSTKFKPFQLVYGRKPKLFNEDEEHKSINERIEEIDELPQMIEKAKTNIIRAQIKQKNYHDKNIKTKGFQIGEKVLYYNAAKEKQWTGKLEEKWKGPYYIHEVMLNGSYKLKELNGKVMKVPVNGELLKSYNSRESFIPYVVI